MRSLHDYLQTVCDHSTVRRGAPLPLGAREVEGGVNFAIFSRHASTVRLELFTRAEDEIPQSAFELDPVQNRTGDIWHIWIAGLRTGQLYGYRLAGPYAPEVGSRFNVHKLLFDPYATAISATPRTEFTLAAGDDPLSPAAHPEPSRTNNAGAIGKTIFVRQSFQWGDDRWPRHPWSQTVIYEMHVRGFTIHPSSGVAHPGTYRGLTEKIPYLKALGVTAVELMPVQEFNHAQVIGSNPQNGQPLHDYWGYDPMAFFAPKASYSSAGGAGQQTLEFKEMVRALHAADIEVILDVVFSHTAESDEHGPTFCWRGIDNAIFYSLQADQRAYVNDAGTGNTIQANHPVVREYILDALRYWVLEMHVDGFRFDLASILGRDNAGRLLSNAPLLEQIAEDPILRETKLIAEAWDAAGAYQVGSFSDRRWAEWNGRYRDDVRRFWRGDAGMLGAFASRLCGSADIYATSGKGPECSINYITCHDGFTLNDLVSFSEKHNLDNGHKNEDGTDANFSANHGVEGPTDDAAVQTLRKRQIRNFLLTLFVSRGVPMLLGGDECGRTQRGNNNAYCQDNEISWFDWRHLDTFADLMRFTRAMIEFRTAHPIVREDRFYSDREIQWLAPDGRTPEWNNPAANQFGCLLREEWGALLLLFNAGRNALEFQLPALDLNQAWGIVIDTAFDFSSPIASAQAPASQAPASRTYRMMPHSSAILSSVIS